MRHFRAQLGAILLLLSALVAKADAGWWAERQPLFVSVGSAPIMFEPSGGDPVAGELFTLIVPENRREPDSRTIAVRFIRLPAIDPQGLPPVIYLASGHSGSATAEARGPRWAMFDAIRRTADVILLDQRGTGLSDRPPTCRSHHGLNGDEVPTREELTRIHVAALEECRAFWQAAEVDLAGYNSAQSADDLGAVAEVLGGKISLLSIGDGSRLALAAIKQHPRAIDRVVMVGVEGLDQTVKMPVGTDAYISRLQQAVNSQPAAYDLYPDIAGMIRRVTDRLDTEPVMVGDGDGARHLTGYVVRMVIGIVISDPERTPELLAALKAADEDAAYGYFAEVSRCLLTAQTDLDAVSTGMDIASGISRRRHDRVRSQAKTSLLGDALNFPMPHLADVAEDLRLPDSFRRRPRGRVPILLFSGTLDGRAYPDEALQATRGLRRHRTVIIVENGGHNIVFDAPEIVPTITYYLAGWHVPERRLVAKLPDFAPRKDEAQDPGRGVMVLDPSSG